MANRYSNLENRGGRPAKRPESGIFSSTICEECCAGPLTRGREPIDSDADFTTSNGVGFSKYDIIDGDDVQLALDKQNICRAR
jgi:hypothetical protein